MSPERVSVGEEGEIHPCRRTKDRKGAGTSRGESGATDLEAERIRKKRGEYRRACKVEDSPVSGGTVNQRASIGEKHCV